MQQLSAGSTEEIINRKRTAGRILTRDSLKNSYELGADGDLSGGTVRPREKSEKIERISEMEKINFNF